MNPIDEYIAKQDEAVQDNLNAVRDTIRSVLPDAVEKISWGMPTWWDQHNLIHMAAAKHHIGIYPGGDGVEYFTAELKSAISVTAKERSRFHMAISCPWI